MSVRATQRHRQKSSGEYKVEAVQPHAPGQPEEPAAQETSADFEVDTRTAGVAATQHGERLDKVVVSLAPEFSRSHLQALIENGHVRVDGNAVCTPARKVTVGQHIEVELVPNAESRAFRAEALDLAVVFEDEHLLVLDKAAGMVVHPAAGHWSGTVLNGLLGRHAGAAALPRAGIVHRLDKDTSGLMLVGKTLAAVTALVRMIAVREVHRHYVAIAHGRVGQAAFSVDAPLGRDPRSRVRMAVVAGGKPARTDVQCVASGVEFSALRCTLHTGRTHQIRVHLASRGHPLVADAMYGGRPELGLQRQALHAAQLALRHPVGGEPLQFQAAPPADFAAAWRAIVVPA